ncbi:hypothetical protein [Aliiglaciecola litoralis]|uniref:Alpha/beta hydrolase n=1 Tax=Aliiglaciecola litoralis TaxID=582857 RepID=A0ABN1LNR0_9ALTE
MRILTLLLIILFSPSNLANNTETIVGEEKLTSGKSETLFNVPNKPVLNSTSTKYVCQLCPHVTSIYNTKVYEHDGKCPVCNMNLIELHEPSVSPDIKLHTGSGNYFIAGGKGNPHKLINIFYHKPKHFGPSSSVLIVVPGAGRNAWSYRDSWIEASEKYNVLILSPAYAEVDYGFGDYHLGRTVSSFTFTNQLAMEVGKKTGKYYFSDDELAFDINNNSDTWIFNDFDRIFEQAIESLATKQTRYDIFGHSAGGQILHRLAIFKPMSKVNRILASNSGSYTIANYEHRLPFGLRDSQITEQHLHRSFASHLVLLIGELDNEEETSGSMLHTPIVDKQGQGRLSRSQYFYQKGKQQASDIGANFNWKIEVVQGVGHNYKDMGKAAAIYLYAD